jgi:hypothetical protein
MVVLTIPRARALWNANGAFKRRLRALRLQSGKHGWKDLLSDIARITNTMLHSALPVHVTPYNIFFGRDTSFETARADITEVWVDWLEDDEQQASIPRVSKVSRDRNSSVLIGRTALIFAPYPIRNNNTGCDTLFCSTH